MNKQKIIAQTPLLLFILFLMITIAAYGVYDPARPLSKVDNARSQSTNTNESSTPYHLKAFSIRNPPLDLKKTTWLLSAINGEPLTSLLFSDVIGEDVNDVVLPKVPVWLHIKEFELIATNGCNTILVAKYDRNLDRSQTLEGCAFLLNQGEENEQWLNYSDLTRLPIGDLLISIKLYSVREDNHLLLYTSESQTIPTLDYVLQPRP